MIRLVCVGRLRQPYYVGGVRDYQRRISRFARIESIEIPDKTPEIESQGILKAVQGNPVVACDPRGKAWSSQELSEFLGRHGGPCFIIGGPEGLGRKVRDRADVLLKLSDMTLPHEMARLLLLEQIYRGFTILRGHPYHR